MKITAVAHQTQPAAGAFVLARLAVIFLVGHHGRPAGNTIGHIEECCDAGDIPNVTVIEAVVP